ncbi:MAG: deoxyribodipyrimidine photo-lyase [Idiomarina sp.]
MAQAIWFRGDLRLTDNPAVTAAVQEQQHEQAPNAAIPALFLVTPKQWQEHHWAPIKTDLLLRHLQAFRHECAERGIALHVREVASYTGVPAAVTAFCDEHGVSKLHYNHEYPLHEARRDRAVVKVLQHDQVAVQGYHGLLLAPPQAISTQTGGFYKMFTPFNRAWRTHIKQANNWQVIRHQWPDATTAPELPDLDLPRRDSSAWVVGEQSVLAKLRRYVSDSVADYKAERDLPALDSTSRLSPYWELGMLSPYTAARALSELSPEFPYGLPEGADVWLTELAWREFYQHLMHHVPRLSMGKAFQEYTDNYPWRTDKEDFKRWCEGRTGYPIVDAGMRQLLQEGYMHNRLRMIVANFLVKDLRLDWRWGEQFFMEQLIDGSFPANNGGWQWSASTGTDAVPYFRVFNPTRQSEKVDPDGSYIRKWVTELAQVPTKYIHAPQQWLEKHGQNDYPLPMVDHGEARDDFLQTFKRVKNEF